MKRMRVTAVDEFTPEQEEQLTINSEVYNALERICDKHDVTEYQLERAVDWFRIHYFD